jgi:inner membrane protein YidH
MARRADARDVGEEPDVRFTLANERTYLAWIRTSLALIGGGLAASQLITFESDLGRLLVALPPIVLGAVLAFSSYRRWEANQRAMRLGEPLPFGGPPRLLAVGIGGVAIVVAVIVVVDAFSR